MNDPQIELLTLVYWLLDRLEHADVPTAKLVAERLLHVLSPLAQPVATDSYPTQKESYGPEIRH